MGGEGGEGGGEFQILSRTHIRGYSQEIPKEISSLALFSPACFTYLLFTSTGERGQECLHHFADCVEA